MGDDGKGEAVNRSTNTLACTGQNTRKVEKQNIRVSQPTNKLSQHKVGTPNKSSHRDKDRKCTRRLENLAGASVRPAKGRDSVGESVGPTLRGRKLEVSVGESVRPTKTEEYTPVAEKPPRHAKGGESVGESVGPTPGGRESEVLEGESVRPTKTEEYTPVTENPLLPKLQNSGATGESVGPVQRKQQPDNDIKKLVCKMKVSVKGIEIEDMRSYLAKKKQEREQKDKKNKKSRDHPDLDLLSLLTMETITVTKPTNSKLLQAIGT